MLQVLLRLVHFVFVLVTASISIFHPHHLVSRPPAEINGHMTQKAVRDTERERPRFDRCKEQLRWVGAPAWVESDLPKGSDLAVTLRCQCGGNHL